MRRRETPPGIYSDMKSLETSPSPPIRAKEGGGCRVERAENTAIVFLHMYTKPNYQAILQYSEIQKPVMKCDIRPRFSKYPGT